MHLRLASYLAEERSSRELFRCDTAIVPGRPSWPVGEFAFKAVLRLAGPRMAWKGRAGPWRSTRSSSPAPRRRAIRLAPKTANTRPGFAVASLLLSGACQPRAAYSVRTTMEGRDDAKAQLLKPPGSASKNREKCRGRLVEGPRACRIGEDAPEGHRRPGSLPRARRFGRTRVLADGGGQPSLSSPGTTSCCPCLGLRER